MELTIQSCVYNFGSRPRVDIHGLEFMVYGLGIGIMVHI
jgi:hypothetical protein